MGFKFMRSRYRYQQRGSLAMGIVAITVGVIFSFYEAGAFPANFRLDFWAVVLVALGLVQLLAACRDTSRLWAVALVAIGVIIQTNVMGYTHLHIRNMWPLIIILVGVSSLWRSEERRVGKG